MKPVILICGLLLGTGCADLITVHYVNDANPRYGAAATGYRDTDGDGIKDYSDLCPGTRPGEAVSDAGCPVHYAEATQAQCDDPARDQTGSPATCDSGTCVN